MRKCRISSTFSGERSHFTVSHGRRILKVGDGVKSMKRLENLMHHKPDLIHPYYCNHNDYTPFTVVTVGGAMYRDKLGLQLMIFFLL